MRRNGVSVIVALVLVVGLVACSPEQGERDAGQRRGGLGSDLEQTGTPGADETSPTGTPQLPQRELE